MAKEKYMRLFDSDAFRSIVDSIEKAAPTACETVVVANTKTGRTIHIVPDQQMWCYVGEALDGEDDYRTIMSQEFTLVAATKVLIMLTSDEADLQRIRVDIVQT